MFLLLQKRYKIAAYRHANGPSGAFSNSNKPDRFIVTFWRPNLPKPSCMFLRHSSVIMAPKPLRRFYPSLYPSEEKFWPA